jgi:tRNA G46 methylase TrmB
VNEENLAIKIIPAGQPVDYGWQLISTDKSWKSTLDLAHEALDIASSEVTDIVLQSKEVQEIVIAVKYQLQQTLGTDIRGRSAADAAFSLAMAGVKDEQLYSMLATIACKELKRIGRRPSFRAKYILQIVEKLAASGLRGSQVDSVYHVAADCLRFKGEHLDIAEAFIKKESFGLFSPRPLLWLWRFSSKQSKVGCQPFFSKVKPDPSRSLLSHLQDTSRPLVLDLGCGMGVSLLGLASTIPSTSKLFVESEEGSLVRFKDWRDDANYVGCDMSSLTIGFAQGIASRWNLGRRLQFVHQSAHSLLEEIELGYKGKVALIMIQFPSPYRFQSNDGGNSQLPVSIDDGFMVSSSLLEKINRILEKSKGLLLLQSNVEDVAITLQHRARDAGLESLNVPHPRLVQLDISSGEMRMPQRTLEWIQRGGQRAVGSTWSSRSLLPPRGVTETEMACHIQGSPVHRCLFRSSQRKGT